MALGGRTIEERRWDQSCLFQRGDYRNNGYNPNELSCIDSQKDGFSDNLFYDIQLYVSNDYNCGKLSNSKYLEEV